MPKVSLESVQKECVAARTGAWVLQRSVKDFWRCCRAFEAFECQKSVSKACRKTVWLLARGLGRCTERGKGR